jgi:hypothetical protein
MLVVAVLDVGLELLRPQLRGNQALLLRRRSYVHDLELLTTRRNQVGGEVPRHPRELGTVHT